MEVMAPFTKAFDKDSAFIALSSLDMVNQAIANSVNETTSGMAITNLVAGTAQALATTNFQTMMPRNRQTIGTNNGMTEKRASHTCCSRRAVGGGFRCEMVFGMVAAVAAVRAFFGLNSANAAMASADPSALLNMIGFAKDTGDANFSLMSNDGAGVATKTALANTGNLAASVNSVFKVELWCDPGEAAINYRVTRISGVNAPLTVAIDVGTIAADLPVIDTLFVPHMWMGNASVTTHTWDFTGLAIRPSAFAA